VWTGRQARERHLVDGFGGLATAIHDAAQQAKLSPGFHTSYIEVEPKGLTRLLDILADRTARAALRVIGPLPTRMLDGAYMDKRVSEDLSMLVADRATLPRVLAHCLCQAP
jgi:protease-4